MIYAKFEMLKLTYSRGYFNIEKQYEEKPSDRHYNEIGN